MPGRLGVFPLDRSCFSLHCMFHLVGVDTDVEAGLIPASSRWRHLTIHTFDPPEGSPVIIPVLESCGAGIVRCNRLEEEDPISLSIHLNSWLTLRLTYLDPLTHNFYLL